MSRRKPSAAPVNSFGPGELLGRELATAVMTFHEAIAARLGMSATEWKCLRVLHQEGTATPGRLAELSGFTSGAITGLVDRLEKSGYARREKNPHDRRSVIVCPVRREEVQAKVMPIFRSLGSALAAVAGRYSPQELAAIQGYLVSMVEVLRQETTKLAKPQP